MSTTLVAALLALTGIVAVAGVSYVFYLVGRAEDRDRAAAAKPPPPPEPKPDEHPEQNGHLVRERRRPLPPRRDHR
jgi:hypothetical protein